MMTKTIFVLAGATFITALSPIPCHVLANTEYQPLNMPGTFRTVENSLADCQNRCNNVNGCAHFSFWPDGGCHLQDQYATQKLGSRAVAGDGGCYGVPVVIPVPKAPCPILANIEYQPLDMPGTFRSVENNIEDCQSRCNNVAGCAHFSFWADDGGCHLQNEYATKKRGSRAVAGDAGCFGPPEIVNMPEEPELRANCRYFKSCSSCMDAQGCSWDDNWGKCRHTEACDYTKAPIFPVEVAYSLTGSPIDERPTTNTACLHHSDQCRTGGSKVLIPNHKADRCSKVQSCTECIYYNGCVFDHENDKCVTYEHSMVGQCESDLFAHSKYTCYNVGNCF